MENEYICKQDLIKQFNELLNKTNLGEITCTTDISVGEVASLIEDMTVYTKKDLKYQEVKEFLEPFRDYNTHNEPIEELKRIVN